MRDRDAWARIVGPCYTAAGIADVLGCTEAEVGRAADELRLLEVQTSDELALYPAFQVQSGHIVRGLPEVLEVLRTGTAGRWTWVQFLNVSVAGETTHIEHLRAGRVDDVLRSAHEEAAAWNR